MKRRIETSHFLSDLINNINRKFIAKRTIKITLKGLKQVIAFLLSGHRNTVERSGYIACLL